MTFAVLIAISYVSSTHSCC